MIKKSIYLSVIALCVLLFFFFWHPTTHFLAHSTVLDTSEGIMVFDSIGALVDEAKTLKPTFIAISGFDYVANYEDLLAYRAIYAYPMNRVLSGEPVENKTPSIGALDTLADTYLIEQTFAKFHLVKHGSQEAIHMAFDEGLIQYQVGPSDTQHPKVNDLTSLYVDAALLLVRKNDMPTGDAISAFKENHFPDTQFSTPDRIYLTEVVRWLLMNKHIRTRYYFEDLVITP